MDGDIGVTGLVWLSSGFGFGRLQSSYLLFFNVGEPTMPLSPHPRSGREVEPPIRGHQSWPCM